MGELRSDELMWVSLYSAFPTFHIYQGRSRKQNFQGGKALPAFRALLNEHLSAFPLKASSDNKTRMEGVVQALGKVHSNASPPVFEQFCRYIFLVSFSRSEVILVWTRFMV